METLNILETLNKFDTQLLLFLNGFHNEYWDWFMSSITRREIWLPFYIALAYSIFKSKKNYGLIPFFIILLVPVLADAVNSNVIKPFFDRLRPFHVEELKDQLHVFNENPRGKRSFMSGHAMNAFGLATICMLLFRNKWLSLVMLCWAILVSYSRIYLGFHFPGDILAGAITGSLLGWGLYALYLGLEKRYMPGTIRRIPYDTKTPIVIALVVLFCIFAFAYHNLIFIEEFVRRYGTYKL